MAFILFYFTFIIILFSKMDASGQTDLQSRSKTGYFSHSLAVKRCLFFLLFYMHNFLLFTNHLLGGI